MRDKFSSFGRYTLHATALQRLNRIAFNAALAMARLAEKAYLFERPDEAAGRLLSDNHWDAEDAGLLAGERLQLDLQQLERRFIETNYRTLEIEQSFSLVQLAPSELLRLREKGTCTFSIPESTFDLTYRGSTDVASRRCECRFRAWRARISTSAQRSASRVAACDSTQRLLKRRWKCRCGIRL